MQEINLTALICLITDLVVLSTFLYAGQPNDWLTVLQSLVKNGVGVALDLLLLPFWSLVVFLYLFPLQVLQGLEAEREMVVTHVTRPTAKLWASLETVFAFSPASRSLWPGPCFRVSSSCWWIYWKTQKDKSDHPTWTLRRTPSCSELGCLFYLRTGSLKTELLTPPVAALMGLIALSSRCSFSSALSSVSGVL